MFTLRKSLLLVLGLLLVPVSSADMKPLTDHQLAAMTAQNGIMENTIGTVPYSRSSYYQNIQRKELLLANQWLTDRAHFLDELNNNLITDSETLEQQLEQSLITLSTQLASTVAMSSLFPLLGLPIGIGLTSVPGAFDVEVSDVSINMDVNITIRE